MRRFGRPAASRAGRSSDSPGADLALTADARSADPEAAREAALKLLDRARRTRNDLERRLAEKGFAPVTIAEVIERLSSVGLVDDVEYARAFLAGRWGRRAAGWRRLEQDLRGRGIARTADRKRRRGGRAGRRSARDRSECSPLRRTR
jgi:regulatory protein